MKTVRLADYFHGHKGRVSIVAILASILAVAIPTVVALMAGVELSKALLIIALPLALLVPIVIFGVLHVALEPLDMITRAITHVSNQANDATPPDINQPRHEASGLKQMIQTIYDRASLTAAPATDSHPETELSDSLPCGIIVLDSASSVIYANPHAPVVTNSQGIVSLKLQFRVDNTLAEWLASADRDKVSDQRFWERIPDDVPERPERRFFDVLAIYEKGAANDMVTRIITIDRTEAYSEEEEAVDFISVAAHELRGPITVIRGYLDVLIDELGPQLQGDQRELIDRLDVSASRLSGYVNNILNVAKYDRRHLKLHLQEDRLSHIYATIADDLQLRASTQHRLLAVTIPDDLPTIAADRNSLTEVLANLVDNAIKYSPEGGQITVTAEVSGNFVRCSVIDHGIGIPTSVMNSLFTKFYRSHRSRASVAGTGLGLYISRGIVESHGGQIGVSSKEGAGSTFIFSIPIYSTVADTLAAGNNGNEGIIESSSGWIKNHGKIGG